MLSTKQTAIASYLTEKEKVDITIEVQENLTTKSEKNY